MQAAAPLMNTIMRDGSRHFLTLRENANPDPIRARLQTVAGVRICEFSRRTFEWWMHFQCMGWRFSVNNPFGELWFFVEDPRCPEDILNCLGRRIARALA